MPSFLRIQMIVKPISIERDVQFNSFCWNGSWKVISFSCFSCPSIRVLIQSGHIEVYSARERVVFGMRCWHRGVHFNNGKIQWDILLLLPPQLPKPFPCLHFGVSWFWPRCSAGKKRERLKAGDPMKNPKRSIRKSWSRKKKEKRGGKKIRQRSEV